MSIGGIPFFVETPGDAMAHYFIDSPDLPDNEKKIAFSFRNQSFAFTTNSGLFSHARVDAASAILIENIPALQGSLLDLGCGYGVVGIVLAKLYGLSMTMSDVNPKALRYAARNAEANGVEAAIVHSDCFDSIHDRFDAIALNPPIHAGKETVYRMYEGSHAHLRSGGSLFVVIQKKHGAETTLKKLEDIFGQYSVLYRRKGVYVIECTKT